MICLTSKFIHWWNEQSNERNCSQSSRKKIDKKRTRKSEERKLRSAHSVLQDLWYSLFVRVFACVRVCVSLDFEYNPLNLLIQPANHSNQQRTTTITTEKKTTSHQFKRPKRQTPTSNSHNDCVSIVEWFFQVCSNHNRHCVYMCVLYNIVTLLTTKSVSAFSF